MSSCVMKKRQISKEVKILTELFQDLTINPEMSSSVMKKRHISKEVKILAELFQDLTISPESSSVTKKTTMSEVTTEENMTSGEILQDSEIIPEMSSRVMKTWKLNRTPLLKSYIGAVQRVRKIFPRISFPAPSPVSLKPQEKKNLKGTRTKIWIIGSSYVRRAEQEADQNFGENLGLNAKVEWFGQGGMRWSGVQQRFDAELKTQSPPDILVIHAGGNDLGLTSAKILAARMTGVLMQLHARFPSMTIAYSCINERQPWRYGHLVEMDYVNKCIKTAVGKCGGEVIEHPNLKCDDKTTFLADRGHFTNNGNIIFLTSIHSVLKKILQQHHQ